MTAPVIERIDYLGEPAVLVHTSELSGIIVPGWGSNLISLTWRESELELLRTPDSAEAYHAKPPLYGTPVLFPPNRIEDGTFTFNNRTYTFPVNEAERGNHIHGVLMRSAWELSKAEVEGDEAVVETMIVSENVPAVFAGLPHRFTVTMSFVFKGPAVSIRFAIDNRDEEPLPWGLGYHTTFRFPFSPEGSLARCTFQLQADRRWTLNDRNLPTGEITPIANQTQLNAGMTVEGVLLDDVYSATAGAPNEAVMTDPDAGLAVTYRCDEQFGHWVIYNGDGQSGFLCPEPYTWVTNAPNVPLSDELTGFRSLAPRAQVSTFTEIAVRKV
ncbi:aldose 1-epimerase [Paenibacillus sp. 1P07SE]|uniref:aldose 1-epimerase n=1 Tax=Paenibacillus sp. 1P07SE TaxID=3132209 RepID=UPI0039A4B90B